MKKYMIFGTIGLILVFTVGLLTLSSLAFQIGLGADNELNSSNPTLKDVGTNPEVYLGQTVMVEGYAIYYRWQSDSQGLNPFGDFWLSESIENPGNIGIWVNILDKTQPLPLGNSKVHITGEIVYDKDQGGFYSIDCQKMDILEVPYRPQLELFTDKTEYEIGEEVILTFVNHGPEGILVQLANSAPFEIEFQDLESNNHFTYSLPIISPSPPMLISVQAGESMTWTLRESEGLMGAGYYTIIFRVYVDETLESLYTKFIVGVPLQRPYLELFTDKITYDIGEEVILTFANHGPEDINVILPNGAPFEIEFRDLESGEVTVFSLPAIQVLIPVPAGESVIWSLRESEGLLGSGYYKITFHVIVEETRDTLVTNFTVGVPYTSLALFTDKEIYTEGEDVTLTFVNQDSRKVNAGYCFEISYQGQKNGPSITYGIACIEILVILPPGESITWTLTPADLMGPGYYTINYSVHYDDGQPQNFQTNFIVVSAESALFTNKHVYTEEENVTLTFVNQDTYPVGAGYCFEISYREQQYGPSTPIIRPCPLIYLKLPPGENITWILTSADLMGSGYYTVNYSVSADDESKMFQTEFVIVASDELFTDKEVYIDGENITLTFENRAFQPAYASYCFDIIYRAQETGPSTTYDLPCIEIEVIIPSGGNIAWTLTPAELKGPGQYSINYRIYRGERVEILQTEFMIQPKNTPVSTPFFVPGFGAIATIIAMLGVLLFRMRKKI